MIRQTLWAEFIVGGAFYLLSIIFILLLIEQRFDFELFYTIKDSWPIISLISIFFSYVLGYLVHRTIYLFVSIFKHEKTLNNEEIVILYQFGNNDLIENINHQYKLIVTSRLLCPGLILFGLILGIWLSKSQFFDLSCLVSIIFVLMGSISLFISLKQKKEYKALCHAAVKLLKEKKTKSD